MRPNGTEKQIRPKAWWAPSEHTMLYIPMDTTYGTTDQSQYHRSYTVSWLTHTTYGWVDCYQNSSWIINLWTSAYTWLAPSSLEATYSFWVYPASFSNYSTMFCWAIQNYYFYNIWRLNNKIWIDWWNPNTTEWSAYGTQWYANWWHLFVWTITWWRDYLYVDGNLVTDNTSYSLSQIANNGFGAWHISSQIWIYIFADRNGRGKWSWYVWQIIFEDKARTIDEISNYYNKTKSNYWY